MVIYLSERCGKYHIADVSTDAGSIRKPSMGNTSRLKCLEVFPVEG